MNDKVIVITGASSGIGAAVARRVGQMGASLVLAARRERELRAVAAESGPRALAVVADVTRRAEVEGIVTASLGRFGRIDVWINNAGRGITRQVAELTDEDLDEMMRVNVKSALYGMQAVLPHMKERKRGHIINISSVLSRIPFASIRSAYSASKHALMSRPAGRGGRRGDRGFDPASSRRGLHSTDLPTTGRRLLHGRGRRDDRVPATLRDPETVDR